MHDQKGKVDRTAGNIIVHVALLRASEERKGLEARVQHTKLPLTSFAISFLYPCTPFRAYEGQRHTGKRQKDDSGDEAILKIPKLISALSSRESA